MRRKDREMSADFGLMVIDEARFGTLSVSDPDLNVPYAVPLSIVRSGQTLYFHAAKAGRKHELLGEGTPVRIVFVGHANVPDLFSDSQLENAANKGIAGALLSNVFTTEYRSAIVTGTIHKIDFEQEPERFKEALRLVCEKYTPDKMRYFEAAFQSGAPITDVFAVHIDSIRAKRKQFNAFGQEMKGAMSPD